MSITIRSRECDEFAATIEFTRSSREIHRIAAFAWTNGSRAGGGPDGVRCRSAPDSRPCDGRRDLARHAHAPRDVCCAPSAPRRSSTRERAAHLRAQAAEVSDGDIDKDRERRIARLIQKIEDAAPRV